MTYGAVAGPAAAARPGTSPGRGAAPFAPGWDDALAAAWAAAEQRLLADLGTAARQGVPLPATAAARVVRAHRGACDLLPAPGYAAVERATWGADVLAAAAADPAAAPVTGDWVLLACWADGRDTVEAVLPRRTAVVRAQPRTSQVQVLAAGVDVVAVVEGLVPDPDPARLERLLALAWASGARPVVVLTKADLVPDPAAAAAAAAALAPGCEVVPVAAPRGEGLGPLHEVLRAGATLALIGASGVGKSTLVNALVGDGSAAVRGLRGDGKGRHTTVTRELHLAPAGGAVLDTPGVRGVGLAGGERLEEVFADVEALAAGCRFADCSHTVEPGCAVTAALDDGRLAERRWGSYRKLQRERQYQAARTDARLAAERGRRWRAVRREVRRGGHRP